MVDLGTSEALRDSRMTNKANVELVVVERHDLVLGFSEIKINTKQIFTDTIRGGVCK